MLGHGIYAVRVHIDGARHDGAAYLGTRPTYDNGMPVLEVFLFDFDGDLYGREIEVEFVDFVRADRKFDTSEALIAQMQLDIARARDILAAGLNHCHPRACPEDPRFSNSTQSCAHRSALPRPRSKRGWLPACRG